MLTALSTATNVPDVMMIEAGYLGQFSALAQLDDLTHPPYRIQQHAARYADFALAAATLRNGKVLAAPTDIGPGTLLYRADLLKAAHVEEAELTQSWASFLAAGVKIKEATGAHLLPHARHVSDLLIRSTVPNGEGLYFDVQGIPQVKSQRFVDAFTMARRVRELGLDAGIDLWSDAWKTALAQGRLATLMTGSFMTQQLPKLAQANTASPWRAAQLPAKAWSTWGGTYYAIPKSSRNKRLAWDFIQFMSLRRDTQMAAFRSHHVFPALLSTYNDPYFGQPITALGDQPARLLWREAATHITPVYLNELDQEARAIVNNELQKVLDHGKAIPQALHDASKLLEKLAGKHNQAHSRP